MVDIRGEAARSGQAQVAFVAGMLTSMVIFLMVFAFLALFPFPLVILAGVTILVIWRYHRRDLLEVVSG